MASIPFVDLKAQYKRIEREIRSGIDGILEHGRYVMGPEIDLLEKKLAEYAGVKHCLSCSSGTDALLMPLMAYGVGPGDAVLTTPFTFVATAEVISLLGARPIFVDIDPDTFNISPQFLEKTLAGLETRPKAVIAVDLFGLPADYDAIADIARRYGLHVIDDAAQGFGATYKGRRLGSIADVTATSFFPSKPLGCYGDGGAIFTDDDNLAEIMRSIRVHGMGQTQYDNVRIGINGRLDSFQAAVLLAKLEIFDDELKARRELAARYDQGLRDCLKTPFVPDGSVSAWAQYSVLSDKREIIRQALNDRGIPTAVYYPKPLHMQKAYAGLGYAPEDLPNALRASEKIFSLPMHPYLDAEIADRIIGIIRQAA